MTTRLVNLDGRIYSDGKPHPDDVARLIREAGVGTFAYRNLLNRYVEIASASGRKPKLGKQSLALALASAGCLRAVRLIERKYVTCYRITQECIDRLPSATE